MVICWVRVIGLIMIVFMCVSIIIIIVSVIIVYMFIYVCCLVVFWYGFVGVIELVDNEWLLK